MISGRLILIALCVCVNLLCSCSTQYKPVARNSLPPASASQLPPESTAHESFRHGFPFALTVRFGDGEEALFLVDTGCSRTTLDSSFEPSLGPCLGKEWVSALEGGIKRAKVFAAPKLYLGNTQLITGDTILTGKAAGPYDCPYKGILGVDCLSHYCIQMDFAAGRVRFLDPHRPKGEDLGSAFPILPPTALSPVPLINMDLSKVGSFRFMVDSGFWNVVDVTLTPALMRKASQNKLVTATSLFVGFRVFSCDSVVMGGENYKDLLMGEVPIKGDQLQGFIGRRFLARHLVTFDFPNRVLYLKRKVPGFESEH